MCLWKNVAMLGHYYSIAQEKPFWTIQLSPFETLDMQENVQELTGVQPTERQS